MRIKGIDLYKKVLLEDESILKKRFRSERFGEILISDWYNMGWGMTSLNEGGNILASKSPKEMHNLMLTEWEEVRKPVTWQEAIKAKMNGKEIHFIYKYERYELYGDCLGVNKINENFTESCSEEEIIKFDMLQNGEWFIGD